MVASIMRHVADKTKMPMETLYQDIGWPLNKKYGNALDAFKMSITYAPRSRFPLQRPPSNLVNVVTLTSGTKWPSPTTS
jgi:translation initiation factor 2 alpha subunit (eIF-2alpha)